ncbi:uncharacterized protein LOC131078498 isoform X2 [Cryptomeria japonica]|uniref:uncharacterized protein LOC131078498 isoform X2 n=1 Tax=Cryptomeria japonica TaxID=3369 RepID=UPI0027D9CEAE|nr:uncharacterized protein LOC131078498 isoform X2 [Cryptomeria japonica]
MEANVPDYRRIVVRGRTALEQAGHFTIRVFAQIQGVSGDSMASQGDVGCCYVNVEDACETGCVAACERASYNAHSASAKQVGLYHGVYPGLCETRYSPGQVHHNCPN